MQSNQINSRLTSDPITINDLLVMMMSSGWAVETDKPFYKVLNKGARSVVLTAKGSDYTLVCTDIDPDGERLILPCISKLNPFPLMAILMAYGIVSLMSIAKENDIDIHDVISMEAALA